MAFFPFSFSYSRNCTSWNPVNSSLESYITQCIQPFLFHPSSLFHHAFHFVRYFALLLIYYLLWYFIFSPTISIVIFFKISRVYMTTRCTIPTDFINSHWLQCEFCGKLTGSSENTESGGYNLFFLPFFNGSLQSLILKNNLLKAFSGFVISYHHF